VATDAIVLGPGAIRMARRVGPTALAVLTALSVDAKQTAEALLVRASVRSLAAELGLNEDTVARALIRLRDARLVESMTGPFEPSAYRLTIPAGVINFVVDTLHRRDGRARYSSDPPAVQLALLDVD
jgi:hypothetical protein